MNEELSDLGYEEFVRARKLHWQQGAKNAGTGVVPPQNDAALDGEPVSNFMMYAPGPQGIFAVFEDSDQTGWFYLYSAQQKKILRCADIYNRANVFIDEDVVDIGWAVDGSASGLAVWGEFRAFLGVSNDLEMRKPVMNAEEDGIPATEWPAGFDRYREPKFD
jgi:hypothetical protein